MMILIQYFQIVLVKLISVWNQSHNYKNMGNTRQQNQRKNPIIIQILKLFSLSFRIKFILLVHNIKLNLMKNRSKIMITITTATVIIMHMDQHNQLNTKIVRKWRMYKIKNKYKSKCKGKNNNIKWNKLQVKNKSSLISN